MRTRGAFGVSFQYLRNRAGAPSATVHGEGRTAEEAIAGISRAIHDSGSEPLMFR